MMAGGSSYLRHFCQKPGRQPVDDADRCQDHQDQERNARPFGLLDLVGEATADTACAGVLVAEEGFEPPTQGL